MPACAKPICRSSRMSGRKSAMPPSVSMLKPWQTTTSVTVSAASRRRGAAGEETGRDTGRPERKTREDSCFLREEAELKPPARGRHSERRRVVLGDVQGVDAGPVVGLRQPQPVLEQLAQRFPARIHVVENAEFHFSSDFPPRGLAGILLQQALAPAL